MSASGDDEDFMPVEVDTFRLGSHPEVRDEEVGDGTYGYLFEFVAPAVKVLFRILPSLKSKMAISRRRSSDSSIGQGGIL